MSTAITITAGAGHGQLSIFSKRRGTEIETEPGPFRPDEDAAESDEGEVDGVVT